MEISHRKCGGKRLYSHDGAGDTASYGIRKRSKRCNGSPSRNRCFDPPLTRSLRCEADRSSQLNHECVTSSRRTSIPHKLRVSNILASTSPDRGRSENSLTIRQSSNGRITSDETHQHRDDSLLPETTPQSRLSSDIEANPVTLQAVFKDVSFLTSMRECLRADFDDDQKNPHSSIFRT